MTEMEILHKTNDLLERSMKQFDDIVKIVKDTIKKYPNDEELGTAIRYLFSDVKEKNTDKN